MKLVCEDEIPHKWKMTMPKSPSKVNIDKKPFVSTNKANDEADINYFMIIQDNKFTIFLHKNMLWVLIRIASKSIQIMRRFYMVPKTYNIRRFDENLIQLSSNTLPFWSA